MSPFTAPQLTLRNFLGYIGIISLVLLFTGYSLFQARFLIKGPGIELFTEAHVVQDSRIVTLEGRADNIAGMTLNGRAIYTDESGYFKETVVLENGYTVTTLRAQDRYGRTTTKTRSFVYTNTKISDNS